MSVVEPGTCWDVYENGIGGDESFENLFSLLDFPIESVEGNEHLGVWDVSKSQCLGPIPPNVLEPLINHGSSGLAASIGGAPESKQVPDCIQESSVLKRSRIEITTNLRIFQSSSPNSVLESNGSCSARKSSLKSGLVIPVKGRSKRLRAVGNPWLALSPFVTTNSSSSVSNAKQERRQRKKTILHQSDTQENKNKTLQKIESLQLAASDKDQLAVATKKCAHCEVTKTPQWREGPTGPKTLCNACGVRYRSGRLFPEYRPAASPTFTPALHSNSHKKVIEMRNKANPNGSLSKIDKPPMFPLSEFVPMTSYLFEHF